MKPGTRKSGLDVVGDVPWGTHFALFHQTKEDLIDVLVPYFMAGLENNEYCMWVTAEPLCAGEARAHLAAAMPDFDRYVEKGQIEIIPFSDWYAIDGKFDAERVLNGWIDRLRQARERGFDGLRLTGNVSWLDRGVWKPFIDYEQKINEVIGKYTMIALCSYAQDQCDAGDILDVVSTHQFALNRRNGDWKIIEDQGQKRTRKALRESEASLAKSQEMAHIGSWEMDVATGEIERSAESYRIFGLAPDEYMITYEKFLDFVVPENRERVAREIRSAVEAGQPYDATFRIRRKDGEIRVLHSKAEPIKDASGRIVTLFGTNQDITERKRAEEALRESEEQLRLASQAAGIGVWSWVPGTRQVVVSANWRRLFGVPGEAEVTFDTWVNSLHHEDRGRAVRELNEASEQRREFDTEYRVVRPDGTMLWIVDRGHAWYDESGRPAGMAGVNVDITGRKQAEEDSAREQRKLMTLLDSLPGYAFVKDTDFRYVQVNGMISDALGIEKESIVGKTDFDLFPPDLASKYRSVDRALLESGRPMIVSDEYTLDRGRQVPIMTRKVPLIDDRGIPLGIIGLAFDISERLEAEEALKKSEANLAKSQEMAHIGNWEWKLDPGRVVWSDESYRIYGLVPGRVRPTYELFLGFIVPEDRERVDNIVMSSVRTGKPYNITYRITRLDDESRTIQSEGQVIRDATGRVVGMFGTNQDITERQRSEEERETTVRFLSLVNETRSTKDLIQTAAAFFQQRSGCEAVGILLREGDDYPYYEARGFRPEFIRKENLLCTRDKDGRILRDKDGFPLLDCMCGNVITGRSDPSQPFFTERGSFWTNSTTELLAATTEKDRLARTRNVCNTEGYESFALIALRVGNERLGALQLNDRRKGHFTPEQIAMWERLADYLAVALAKFQAEEALIDAKTQAELYLDLMGHDINNMHQIALGYLELARDMIRTDEHQEEFLEKPIEVLQRSARLIGNVRKLQKLQEGLLQTSVVDVCTLLADVQREFGSVPEKSITLNMNGCRHCRVRANELLYDVFANLVTNALKHTGDRAEILIGLEKLTEDGRHYCRATVEDDGPGIPDEFKGRIFNRLLKGTEKAKGMGLGLYLAKSLVDSYGGRVWVEDRVKGDHTKGAKFVVMLPAFMKNEIP